MFGDSIEYQWHEHLQSTSDMTAQMIGRLISRMFGIYAGYNTRLITTGWMTHVRIRLYKSAYYHPRSNPLTENARTFRISVVPVTSDSLYDFFMLIPIQVSYRSSHYNPAKRLGQESRLPKSFELYLNCRAYASMRWTCDTTLCIEIRRSGWTVSPASF